MGTVGALTVAEIGLDDPDGCDTIATAMTSQGWDGRAVVVGAKTYSTAQMTFAYRFTMDTKDLPTGSCLTRAVPFLMYGRDSFAASRYFGDIMRFTGDSKTYLIDEFSHVTHLAKVGLPDSNAPPQIMY